MRGKDNEGEDMPRYRHPEYANFKTTINPKNRGFWDLKVTGEYQKMIGIKIYPAIVFFSNNLKGEKAQWLHSRLGTRHLGIREEQMYDFQTENKPEIRAKILKIINGM